MVEPHDSDSEASHHQLNVHFLPRSIKGMNVLMIVSYKFCDHFFTIYVFEVRESISDIPTELLCSYDLENPGQLPGLGGTLKYCMIVSHRFSQFL